MDKNKIKFAKPNETVTRKKKGGDNFSFSETN